MGGAGMASRRSRRMVTAGAGGPLSFRTPGTWCAKVQSKEPRASASGARRGKAGTRRSRSPDTEHAEIRRCVSVYEPGVKRRAGRGRRKHGWSTGLLRTRVRCLETSKPCAPAYVAERCLQPPTPIRSPTRRFTLGSSSRRTRSLRRTRGTWPPRRSPRGCSRSGGMHRRPATACAVRERKAVAMMRRTLLRTRRVTPSAPLCAPR